MNTHTLPNRLLPAAVCLLLGMACTVLADDEAAQGPGVSLTIYNQNFAIVKQRRLMTLPQKAGEVKFADVAATIVPESVQFSSLKPGGAKVLEQNYEFDLVSAGKLLQKYIDREIAIVGRDGSLTEGTLLSSDAAQVVLNNDEGVQLIPRINNIKDIRFSSLPGGLLTRPTLVWRVKADEPGEHLVKVAYRANSIKWRVDYRAVAAADEKTLDLAGWVTINNNSGTAFEDAGIKLMAGDLNLVPEGTDRSGSSSVRHRGKGGMGFQEKSFAEYHLYTLGRRTTLANAQTKQIELINVNDIPVEKRYLYQPAFGNRVGVMLQFKNSKETVGGLGIPLPKGPFRVYLRDSDDQSEFVGADAIDHTPKDEPVKIRIGYAFDLVVERVKTDNRRKAGQNWNEQDWKITLRNHKDQPVKVVVEEPLTRHLNWKILEKSHDYEKKDYRTLEFTADVPANAQTVITYTVRYTW